MRPSAMAASTHVGPSRPDQLGERIRLDSWKEIAAHFGRDVRTVQRWEKHEGLPVHRHLHQKRGSVQAIASDLDAWWQVRCAAGEPLEAQHRWYERKRLMAVGVCGVLTVAGVVVVAFGAGWFRGSTDGDSLHRASSAARRTDPVLLQLLERGRLYRSQFTPEGARKAIATFEEAVTRAPNSAEAQAGLAIAHIGAINPYDGSTTSAWRKSATRGRSGDAVRSFVTRCSCRHRSIA